MLNSTQFSNKSRRLSMKNFKKRLVPSEFELPADYTERKLPIYHPQRQRIQTSKFQILKLN